MITAEKKPSFNRLFRFYQENYLIPRHFHTVEMKGELDLTDDTPVLYIANHSSWWDGLLVYQIFETFSTRDHYVLMTQEQLENYRFFRKLGAFSIDPSNRKDIITSLTYAKDLMAEGKAVWIFPQGRIMNQDIRPLPFMTGIGYLLKKSGYAAVKPVSLHYSFYEHQKPSASLIFGESVKKDWSALSRHEIADELRLILEKQLDEHKELIIEHPAFGEASGFRPVLKKGVSTSERFDRMKKGLKKWLWFSHSSS